MKQSNFESIEGLAKIFKALSSEQRLELFLLICQGFQPPKNVKLKTKASKKGCCAGVERAFTAACECMNLSRSTISHHFKELQNAGLIHCERRGQGFYCEVNQEALKAVQSFMK